MSPPFVRLTVVLLGTKDRTRRLHVGRFFGLEQSNRALLFPETEPYQIVGTFQTLSHQTNYNWWPLYVMDFSFTWHGRIIEPQASFLLWREQYSNRRGCPDSMTSSIYRIQWGVFGTVRVCIDLPLAHISHQISPHIAISVVFPTIPWWIKV